MSEKKNKRSLLSIIIILFFIIFLCLYFTQLTDIYEYGQYNKMVMTKEAMKRFEEDINEGKNIELENYLNIVKDYSNGASKLGNKTSKLLENIMGKGIMRTFKIIGKLFT